MKSVSSGKTASRKRFLDYSGLELVGGFIKDSTRKRPYDIFINTFGNLNGSSTTRADFHRQRWI